MKYLLAIFLALTACGRGSDYDHVHIEDNDTYVTNVKPGNEPDDEPDYGPKYISCYDWHTGRPVYGPTPATQVNYRGDYAFIKEYPSGRWVKICAQCFGL